MRVWVAIAIPGKLLDKLLDIMLLHVCVPSVGRHVYCTRVYGLLAVTHPNIIAFVLSSLDVFRFKVRQLSLVITITWNRVASVVLVVLAVSLHECLFPVGAGGVPYQIHSVL